MDGIIGKMQMRLGSPAKGGQQPRRGGSPKRAELAGSARARATHSAGCAAAARLNRRGGAAHPAVLLVDQAAQAEGAPRLVEIAVQVADRHHARRGRQERGVRRRLRARAAAARRAAAGAGQGVQPAAGQRTRRVQSAGTTHARAKLWKRYLWAAWQRPLIVTLYSPAGPTHAWTVRRIDMAA